MPLPGNEKGLNEMVGEILMIILIVALAGILIMIVFGQVILTEKSAYVVPQFNITTVSGKTVITVFDRGGDPVYFNNSPRATYRAALYVDTQFGSYKAVPVPSLTIFQPGDTIYVYNTGSGFALASSLSGATFTSMPAGRLGVRLIDTTSGVLIAQEDLVKAPVTATATVTTAATTTTATLVTITTTSTPVTTSTTPVPLSANFDWVEQGGGGAVHFTDTSTGGPTSWLWNFGDGTTSTARNPVKNFGKKASSDVTLTISRSSDGATSSITKRITTV